MSGENLQAGASTGATQSVTPNPEQTETLNAGNIHGEKEDFQKQLSQQRELRERFRVIATNLAIPEDEVNRIIERCENKDIKSITVLGNETPSGVVNITLLITPESGEPLGLTKQLPKDCEEAKKIVEYLKTIAELDEQFRELLDRVLEQLEIDRAKSVAITTVGMVDTPYELNIQNNTNYLAADATKLLIENGETVLSISERIAEALQEYVRDLEVAKKKKEEEDKKERQLQTASELPEELRKDIDVALTLVSCDDPAVKYDVCIRLSPPYPSGFVPTSFDVNYMVKKVMDEHAQLDA